jgi:tRNA A37 threonylcarbamoyladenosine modification protein TsaB
VGVSSFAAKALEAGREGETVLVAAGAGGEECYSAAFRIQAGLTETVVGHNLGEWHRAAASLEPGWIVAGEGAERIGGLADGPLEIRCANVPNASFVGRLGRNVFEAKGATAPEDLKPLYLRKSKAEITWEQRRKKD